MISSTENYNRLKLFFDEEYHALRGYAKSRISNAAETDAEDIVQDVALKIFDRAEHLSPINNIAGFVYSAIKNRIIDVMRAKKEEEPFEDTMESKLLEFTELLYGKSANSYSEKMINELKNAIGRLKPVYRDIIIAIDFEGYSYKDLCRETGIPQGTLMSRRHRALSLLLTDFEQKHKK